MRLFFSRAPEQVALPLKPGRTLCVYHRRYQPPPLPDCRYVEFEAYRSAYAQDTMLAGLVNLVFVGLNKMITPGNRIDPVFEVLYNLPGELAKYSVDTVPYVGEIWRIWFHFGAVGLPFGGYTYSYLLESHYNAFRDGLRPDNPLSVEAIRRHAADHVSIDYARYFADPVVEVLALPPCVHKEYELLKADLFGRHDRIAPIIRGLSEFARISCPSRDIPQEHRVFDAPDSIRIVRTDLKVDEYLTGRLLAKVSEVNRVVEALQP